MIRKALEGKKNVQKLERSAKDKFLFVFQFWKLWKISFAVFQWFSQFRHISLHETQKYTSKQYLCALLETFDSSKVLKLAVTIRNMSWNDFSNFLWKSILDIYRFFFLDVQKILNGNPHMKNLMDHDFDRQESFFQKF